MSHKEFTDFINLIRNEENVLEIIKNFKPKFLKRKDMHGWTPLHWVVRCGLSSLIRLFIEEGAYVNGQTKANNTPLHLAAQQDNIPLIKILYQNGARLDILNALDETPQERARKYYNVTEAADYLDYLSSPLYQLFESAIKDDVVNFINLFTNQYNLFIIDKETELTLFETLINNQALDIIEYIRSKPILENEMYQFRRLYKEKDVGFMRILKKNPLAQFVLTREVLHFEDNICVENASRITALNFKYPLELAVTYGSRLVVADVQKYLINSHKYSNYMYQYKKGTKEKIKKELHNRNKYLRKKYKKKYTRLHVAVMDDCPDVVEYILDKGICDINVGETVGPPIYQCIKLENEDCLNVLKKYQPNLDYIDKNNQSTLQLMIRNNIFTNYDNIVNSETNDEHRDKVGLTALHLAVIEGQEEIVHILIHKDDEWNRALNIKLDKEPTEFIETDVSTIDYDLPESVKYKLSSKENVISLNLKMHNTIFDCFLFVITEDDVLNTDGDGNNILHLSSTRLLSDICEEIMKVSSQCLFQKNKKENTPLMELIELAISMNGNVTDDLIETVECLISDGDDVHLNAEFTNGETVIQRALEAENEKLMLTLTMFKPFIKKFTEENVLFCVEQEFYTFINLHIERFLKSATEEAITQDVFMQVIDEAPYECIENMYMYSDDTNKHLLVENMMYVMYKSKRNMDMFHRISKIDISTPQLLKCGETLLTFIIKEEDIDIMENILMMDHCEKLVNMKNAEGYLPIHLAVENKQYDFFQSLIPLVNNADAFNVKGESILYHLIKQLEEVEEEDKSMMLRIIKGVIRIGGNIYQKNEQLGEAPIQQCEDVIWKHKIEKAANQIKPPQQQQIRGLSSLIKCSICSVNKVDCKFKCGHIFCLSCGFRVNMCPICRDVPTFATRMSYD